MSDMHYIALRRRDGTVAAVVARAALELHLLAAVAARAEGNFGRVSDAFLSTLDGVDTTTRALELELEGIWDRVDTGYRFAAAWLNPISRSDAAPRVPKVYRDRRDAGS